MSKRRALLDSHRECICQLLPGQAGRPGATAKDNRLFVDAVLYRYRAGSSWRDLPQRFGDFRVVHIRHPRWSKTGVWQRVFEALAQEADNEYVLRQDRSHLLGCHPSGRNGGLAGDEQALQEARY